MKKYLLAITSFLASTSIMADRVVSARNFTLEGALFGGATKPEACQAAKLNASLRRNFGEEVESYSRCDCEKNDNGKWVCTVDAKLVKTR